MFLPQRLDSWDFLIIALMSQTSLISMYDDFIIPAQGSYELHYYDPATQVFTLVGSRSFNASEHLVGQFFNLQQPLFIDGPIVPGTTFQTADYHIILLPAAPNTFVTTFSPGFLFKSSSQYLTSTIDTYIPYLGSDTVTLTQTTFQGIVTTSEIPVTQVYDSSFGFIKVSLSPGNDYQLSDSNSSISITCYPTDKEFIFSYINSFGFLDYFSLFKSASSSFQVSYDFINHSRLGSAKYIGYKPSNSSTTTFSTYSLNPYHQRLLTEFLSSPYIAYWCPQPLQVIPAKNSLSVSSKSDTYTVSFQGVLTK